MISSPNRKAGPFAGDGSTSVFPFSFKVFKTTDVSVVYTDASGTEMTLANGYTVSLNASQDTAPGGTVTVNSAPSVGTKITLTSAVPAVQPMQLTNGGGFFPRVLNDSADRHTILIQQLYERMARTISLPISDGQNFSLPGAAGRLGGKVLGFDRTTGALAVTGSDQFKGDPGGNAESVGPFAQAKTLSLNASGGVQQVRLADRNKALFERTAAALDPAGENYEWFRDASNVRWRIPTGVNVDPVALGATPGGASTAAIARALVVARENVSYRDPRNAGQNPGVVLEPGTYLAGDILHSIYTNADVTNPSGTSRLILRARVPGTVNIIVPDGKWFMTVGGRYMSVDVYGITFIGGAGAFKFTHDGNNVNEFVWFERCKFYGYTVCAIGNMADDAPYLRVRDCIFDGTATSIGVAWGGYLDLVIIEGNIFLRNRYHLKLGERLSGSFHVIRNDFIKNGTDFYREADIWIIPNHDVNAFGSSAGTGATIAFNKFGNENVGRFERRVIIADENPASGADRLTRTHSNGVASGYVVGIAFFRNFIGTLYHVDAGKDGNGNIVPGAPRDGNDAPFMAIYCPNTFGFRWRENSYAGGRYQWLAFFYTMPYADQYTGAQTWDVEIEADAAFQYGAINAPVGRILDRHGKVQTDRNALPSYPSGRDDTAPGLKHDGTLFTAGTAFGAAIDPTPVVDQYGGPGLRRVTFPTAGSLIYFDIANIGYADAPHWFEIQLGNVATGADRLREVIIDIRNYATGQLAFTRTVQVTDGVIGPIPFVMPAANGGAEYGWQLRVKPVDEQWPITNVGTGERAMTTANQIVVGRCFVSIGKAPANTRQTVILGGRWNQPHMVFGPYHLWFDATNRLRFKGDGAPTGDLQGVLVPVQGAADPNSTATAVNAAAAPTNAEFNALVAAHNALLADHNDLLAKLRASGALA